MLTADVSDASGGSLVDGADSAEAGVSVCEEGERGGRKSVAARAAGQLPTYRRSKGASESERTASGHRGALKELKTQPPQRIVVRLWMEELQVAVPRQWQVWPWKRGERELDWGLMRGGAVGRVERMRSLSLSLSLSLSSLALSSVGKKCP